MREQRLTGHLQVDSIVASVGNLLWQSIAVGYYLTKSCITVVVRLNTATLNP